MISSVGSSNYYATAAATDAPSAVAPARASAAPATAAATTPEAYAATSPTSASDSADLEILASLNNAPSLGADFLYSALLDAHPIPTASIAGLNAYAPSSSADASTADSSVSSVA